jgi:hypothetical protein
MTQIEMAAIELQMKEQRVAYWERNHKLHGCREMADCFDNMQATI